MKNPIYPIKRRVTKPIEEPTTAELKAEIERRERAQAELQQRIYRGELEATDGDDIHEDPRSWKHQ